MKNTLSKGLKVFIIVIALTFSTNSHATTSLFGWSWWGDWWGGRTHTHRHTRGCGHGGSSGGGTSIPIDGGLGILLVGAAAFGVKKLRDNKNEKN